MSSGNLSSFLAPELDYILGHGTENDFVVLCDDSAELELDEGLVRALCTRRAGLGADGVLRIATAGALLARGVLAELPIDVQPDDWFMDYRNADGSLAEMCGNGVRVFAHALVATGRSPVGEIRIGTRAGARPATVLSCDGADATIRVDMGRPEVMGVSTVTFGDNDRHTFAGVAIDVGNPHLACIVPGLSADSLAELPISLPPQLDEEFFSAGANVEISTPVDHGICHMRVHERGAGETRSCGTGIVATAVAALADSGQTEGEITVSVPGGRVQVRIADGRAIMTGPSRLISSGQIFSGALDAAKTAGI